MCHTVRTRGKRRLALVTYASSVVWKHPLEAGVEEQAEGKTRLIDLDVHCMVQGMERT